MRAAKLTCVYPAWQYFPRNASPPGWCHDFVAIVLGAQEAIDSTGLRLKSDDVLNHLTPGLRSVGYRVETSKRADDRIRRPVLFGEQGVPSLTYELDAFHDELGVAVEVEAGRGAANNADYRDIIRASLLVDARFLALLMPRQYRFGAPGKTVTMPAYDKTRAQIDAIYASQRLRLPFEGLLVVGY